MQKAWMIAECVGDSIYEAHTIPFVYMKREWAEFQVRILEDDVDNGIKFKIREVQIVNEGPK
jgi:hypothetical protein